MLRKITCADHPTSRPPRVITYTSIVPYPPLSSRLPVIYLLLFSSRFEFLLRLIFSLIPSYTPGFNQFLLLSFSAAKMSTGPLGLPPVSSELKYISPFLQRADELRTKDPVMAYWCKAITLSGDIRLSNSVGRACRCLLCCSEWHISQGKVSRSSCCAVRTTRCARANEERSWTKRRRGYRKRQFSLRGKLRDADICDG